MSVYLLILGTKDLENHEELILSALAALSNLSYYSMENAVFMSILKELIMRMSFF